MGSEIYKIFVSKGSIYILPFSQKMVANLRERTLPMQFSRLVFYPSEAAAPSPDPPPHRLLYV